MVESKITKIQTLKYIVFSRWFLHIGIVLLGLIQKIVGVAQFNPKVFLILVITYSYNFIYYLYLNRDINKISKRGLYIISLLQVILDQIIFTIILYYTGGIESLSFLFYFITIFIAILLFNEIEIISLTMLAGFLYLFVIVLEYREILPHHWRYATDPGFYQDVATTVHNSATVLLTIVFTAFFAAFIGRIVRSREEALKAESEKVSITLNNLTDGVVVLDSKGHIILLNPIASYYLKVSPDKILNKKINTKLFPVSIHPIVKYISRAFTELANRSSEIEVKTKQDSKIYKINCMALFDKSRSTQGFLTVIRNVTREKELDDLKSDFISIAAHQLRTPLSTIKWLFKMLLEGDAGELKEKQKDLLTKGFQRNNEVIEIVNNLLDVTEIEEGKLPFKVQYTSIETMLDQVYKNSQYNAEQKSIKLKYNKATSDLPKLNIDLQKVRMCLQNLVDNAIKYTPPKGTVTMSANSTENKLLLEVKDNGMGIAEDEQHKLFTKFFRSKRAISSEPTGSGLGLYIVSNVIKKHGGRIWFETEINKGTTFHIELPLNYKMSLSKYK